MKISDEKQINELINGDATLVGISWPESDETEIELTFQIPQKNKNIVLGFTWVSELIIDLDLKTFYGLTWQSEFKKRENKWAVNFDFASDGNISFNCYEIKLK